LRALVERISERLGRHPERRGLLVCDADNSSLSMEPNGEEGLARDRIYGVGSIGCFMGGMQRW